MTFRDLFEEVEKKGWMDREIGVQYRDGGGDYNGYDDEIRMGEHYYGEDSDLIML